LAAFMILVIVEKERHSQSHHIADKKRDLIFSYKLWKTYAVHQRLFTFQWPCLGGLVSFIFILFTFSYHQIDWNRTIGVPWSSHSAAEEQKLVCQSAAHFAL